MAHKINVRALRGSVTAVALATATTISAGISTGAMAQDYPTDGLDYILHVKPGGATDVLARKLASALEDEMDMTVTVENRSGGSGAKQMAVFTRKDADGGTIGSVTASHLGMFQKTGNYTIDDVEWACRMVVDPYLLVVPGDSEIDDLKELVEASKSGDANMSIAGFGEGSGGQIAWEIVAQSAEITDDDVRWVPYDSVKEGIVAVLGGHNDVAIGYVGLTRQHVESGALKVIGILSDEAPGLMPNAVPFSEQGFEVDNDWQQFRGVIMPKGTPADVQNALCDNVKTVMDKPDFQKYMTQSGLNYGFQAPSDFRAFIERQDKATAEWTEKLGMGG